MNRLYLSPSHERERDPQKMSSPPERLDRPLADYLINTSHNTYLDGQLQILGHAAVDAYVRAMKRGVRCVELDVWPNHVVQHRPLGTGVDLGDIARALRDHAWDVSPYPVILSIESHDDPSNYMPLLEDVLGVRVIRHAECTSLETFRHQFLVLSDVTNISEHNGSLLMGEDRDPSLMYRVYPKWTRLWSSNFNPVPYWEWGVQMCALNMQTDDRYSAANDAMFGTVGYVLRQRHRCLGNMVCAGCGRDGAIYACGVSLFCSRECQFAHHLEL